MKANNEVSLDAATTANRPVVWKESWVLWASLLAVALLLWFPYAQGVRELLKVWGSREEYSYGYMIPFISAFLIWQRKNILERMSFTGSWVGLAVAIAGIALLIVGNLSTLFLVVQISLIVVVLGLALALTGQPAFKVIVVPLAFLLFMIPLPSFFLVELSQRLQLISSELGVAVVRAAGISVLLEGNVIDLGTFKLQVVEACSGLRYLFPLLTLSFIASYFFKAPFWKRLVVFLSAIPITVLMNSLRIGAIGITVEYWGPAMAEGILHDFEGWIVFMACTAVLVLEMWILSRVGRERLPLHVAFGVEMPAAAPADAEVRRRSLPVPYICTLLVLAVLAMAHSLLPARQEIHPQRKSFTEFPMTLGKWAGRTDSLEQIYLNELKLDDYLLANFSDGTHTINLYSAYYASQSKGESVHSPRTCMPGGGWEMKSLTQKTLDTVLYHGRPLRVNRAVIQMGDNKQLVYYWFQERGRNMTNEYLVKLYIFWDALTRNRTDGALVRLVTPVPLGESMGAADERLTSFAALAVGKLDDYVPE